MAKKINLDELSTDELKAKLIEVQEAGDQELIAEIEMKLDRIEKLKKRKEKIKKKFSTLGNYKKKSKFEEVRYKSQDWIDMSPAFKEVTCLPGIPTGHVVMNYGKSDTGKSTMALEAAGFAQAQGILPVFIITEKKFSFERAEKMGVDFNDALMFNGVDTIEEGIEIVDKVLIDQEKGDLPYDLLILWDSMGATPSKREYEAAQKNDGKNGGMMVTAKVLREKINRYIGLKINNTRKENYPYTSTLFIVNQAYTAPPAMPTGPPSLVPYGGDAIYYAATLIFRQGGIIGRASKIIAQKNGKKVGFALKSKLVVEKNHITNVTATGEILCTDHGFLLNTKDAIDTYKEEYASDWDLEYDELYKLEIK
jgi:RecA/RadA recombinase|tara:strand:- start:8052 stop:9149 length:1098 start_codon:yes stop_codon:yes gene_type:complete